VPGKDALRPPGARALRAPRDALVRQHPRVPRRGEAGEVRRGLSGAVRLARRVPRRASRLRSSLRRHGASPMRVTWASSRADARRANTRHGSVSRRIRPLRAPAPVARLVAFVAIPCGSAGRAAHHRALRKPRWLPRRTLGMRR
jgi:hypothetical protein